MLPRFSNLSHELILQIVDLLLEEEDGDVDDREFQHEIGAQATNLISSGGHAIFNLSRTSTSFYKFLSPYLFRCITLRNTEKSGQDVQYLCSTSQIAYIKTLHFKCKIPGKEKEYSHDIESIFPAEVDDILGNLSRLPSLATLIIDFGLDDALNDVYDDLEVENSTDSRGKIVQAKEVEKAERQKVWRALIKKTLNAISKTCSDGVREFVFKQCPVRTNSVFCSESFNKWLGKLETFKFEVYGRDVHDDLCFNAAPQFESYINNFDHYFFDGLGNVTHLAIIGHEEGGIGQYCHWDLRVPLRTTHVPKLKKLELEYYSIQDDLLDFLVAHSSTLEHLIINKSFLVSPSAVHKQYPESVYESHRAWMSWFQIYASHEPRALQCVTFIPYKVSSASICGSADFDLSIRIDQVPVKRKAGGKEYGIFPDGIPEGSYGDLGEKKDLITQRAPEGDLDGWCALMGVVKRNRERVRGNGYSMLGAMDAM